MPTIPAGTKPISMTEQAEYLATGRAPSIPGVSLGERLRNAWDAFNGRMFPAGDPLATAMANNPITDQQPAPRQFQYPANVNRNFMPRREFNLTPFEQLRNLAAIYDVAAMCVAARIEEIQSLPFSVVARNKKEQAALQDTCDEVQAFFEHPDKQNDLSAWLGMVLYDLFTIDAPTLYMRNDLGGRLYAMEPVDGATIKPVINDLGRVYEYQQILYGRPETQYSMDELWYKPRWAKTFTPYGSPPTEWIIMRVNMALRKQTHDLGHFTDGNVPAGWATPPDGTSLDPAQIQQFEDAFNAVLEGNDSARNKIKFMPWAFNFTPFSPFSYDTAIDEWMLRITCAAYGVPPQELGFTQDVNKATGEMQEAINERRGLRTLAGWLKGVIFDPTIRERLDKPQLLSISLPGQPTRPAVNPYKQVEWQWHFGDKADELVMAQTHGLDIQNGVITPDESRAIRYGDKLDGKAPGIPTMGGPLPSDGSGAGDSGGSGNGGPAGAMPSLFPQQFAQTPGQLSQAKYPVQKAVMATDYVNQQAVDDLEKWERKARKLFKNNSAIAGAIFQSAWLPDQIIGKVGYGLTKATNLDEVGAIFEDARSALRGEVAATEFFRAEESIDWESYG